MRDRECKKVRYRCACYALNYKKSGVIESKRDKEEDGKAKYGTQRTFLKQKSEAAEDTGGDGEETVGLAELESSGCTSLAAGGGSGSSAAASKAIVDGLAGGVCGLAAVGGGCAGLRGCGGRGGGYVDAGRVLSTARVLGSAVVFTVCVTAASGNTLGSPLSADVVGDSL